MRYILIFLVLANIGYFAWNWYSPEQAAQESAVENLALLDNGLMTLGEYRQQQAVLAESRANDSQVCYSVGDFPSFDEASSFIASAEAMSLMAQLKLNGEALSSQFRVYIPPLSSRGIATITLDSLSEALSGANLEVESYLITRGILENGIALGVFEDRDAADSIELQLSSLGYEVQIQEIPRSSGAITVVLKPPQSLAFGDSQWAALAADRTYLTLAENLCETIAQGLQFP